ncbi:hypothetical protein FKM82_026902 [Ascaphus truei]
MEALHQLKQFDAYPKTLEDFRVKTCGGAVVTVISGLIMLILFFSELQYCTTSLRKSIQNYLSINQEERS